MQSNGQLLRADLRPTLETVFDEIVKAIQSSAPPRSCFAIFV